MIVLLYIVGTLLLMHGVYQLFKYFRVSSELLPVLNQSPSSKDSAAKQKITIFAPVLHEEDNIIHFLTSLSAQVYPMELFKVYVITSEKEKVTANKPNTIDILHRVLSERQFPSLNIVHVHCDDVLAHKTDQLNIAFQHFIAQNSREVVSKSLFLMLDCDSDVEQYTLERFNESIEDGIELYQQPLAWFKNVEKLRSPFMQSFAFQQTYFSISWEIPMFTGRFFPYRLKYFVGHGLCVRGSFLLRIGGFPPLIEDVRMGRYSSFLHNKVKLVPSLGIVEVAKSYGVYVKQSSVWFFGCGLFMSDYRATRLLRQDKHTDLRDVVLLASGVFKALRWMNKGLLHGVSIILALMYGNFPLLLLITLSLLLNSSIPVILVAMQYRDIWYTKFTNNWDVTKVVFNGVFFAPMLYIVNFVGLYYGFIKLIRFYLWGTITLPKTER